MNNFYYKQNRDRGFTLIEMLVSLSLFTIVITISVGAFLSLLGASGGVQSKQSVMTTLTFALDSMTREIRTGRSYNCQPAATLKASNQESYGDTTVNCDTGNTGLSFKEAGSSVTGSTATRISYYFDTATATNTIMRRVGNNTPQSIIADGIKITNLKFFVTGTDRLNDVGSDSKQSTVTIILEAQDETGASTTLQTTVTQRELDI